MSQASDQSKKAMAKVQALKDAMSDLGNPSNMRKYGQMLADMIRLRTRLGSGVPAPGADKGNLKPLADSTKAERARLAGKSELSELTSPGKSNLTRTGQLLDSHAVKSASQGQVSIGPTGTRKSEGGKTLTNQEVAQFVTEGGRPYGSPSRVELKRMNDQIKRDLRNFIKQRLTKTK